MRRKIRRKKPSCKYLYGVIALSAGIALGIKGLDYFANRGALAPEDFDKAEWIEFYNEDGIIYPCYMNEKIHYSQGNKYAYEKEVGEKNNGKLEGTILLPDLDGNGWVGK